MLVLIDSNLLEIFSTHVFDSFEPVLSSIENKIADDNLRRHALII